MLREGEGIRPLKNKPGTETAGDDSGVKDLPIGEHNFDDVMMTILTFMFFFCTLFWEDPFILDSGLRFKRQLGYEDVSSFYRMLSIWWPFSFFLLRV